MLWMRNRGVDWRLTGELSDAVAVRIWQFIRAYLELVFVMAATPRYSMLCKSRVAAACEAKKRTEASVVCSSTGPQIVPLDEATDVVSDARCKLSS